jgi:hypothetical protein
MQNYENFRKAWAKIVAKAWSDPAFKKKLLSNPAETFKTQGIEIPASKKIVINECTNDTLYLSLPEKVAGELSEETLQEIAGGAPTFATIAE